MRFALADQLAAATERARMVRQHVVDGTSAWVQGRRAADVRNDAFLESLRIDAAIRNGWSIAQRGDGIPAHEPSGLLPAGIHQASWGEFATRFGSTDHRRALLDDARTAVRRLRADHDLTHIDVGGSFVTTKSVPGDVDFAVEARTPIDHAAFVDDARRARSPAWSRRLRVDVKAADDVNPSMDPDGASDLFGESMLEFFQHDRAGRPAGVVRIPVDSIPRD